MYTLRYIVEYLRKMRCTLSIMGVLDYVFILCSLCFIMQRYCDIFMVYIYILCGLWLCDEESLIVGGGVGEPLCVTMIIYYKLRYA